MALALRASGFESGKVCRAAGPCDRDVILRSNRVRSQPSGGPVYQLMQTIGAPSPRTGLVVKPATPGRVTAPPFLLGDKAAGGTWSARTGTRAIPPGTTQAGRI